MAVYLTGGLGLLVLVGEPERHLGPTESGLLGTIPWAIVAAWLLGRADRLPPTTLPEPR